MVKDKDTCELEAGEAKDGPQNRGPCRGGGALLTECGLDPKATSPSVVGGYHWALPSSSAWADVCAAKRAMSEGGLAGRSPTSGDACCAATAAPKASRRTPPAAAAQMPNHGLELSQGPRVVAVLALGSGRDSRWRCG